MTTRSVPRAPYVGPRPFAADERDLFFGRSRETADLSALVMAHPLVLQYAQSGAGKSSLINAGLVPALLLEEFDLLPTVRVGLPGVDSDGATNIYIYNAISQLPRLDDDPPLRAMTLVSYLRLLPRRLDSFETPQPRVLIFDQFEELFTRFPDRWMDRADFFAQLRDALAADPLLHVVLSMREDYIAEVDRFAPTLPDGLRVRFRLERLKRDQALSAVIEPIRLSGRVFAPDAASLLVDELRTLRVEKSTGEIVTVLDEYIEPVVLQVVCDRMSTALPDGMQTIEVEDVQRYASVDNALTQFYRDCVRTAARETGTGESEIYSWFESNLITQSGTRHAVQRDRETTAGLPNAALDVLLSEHVLRVEQRSTATWCELAHDRFVNAVRDVQRQRAEEALLAAQDSAASSLAQRFEASRRRMTELRQQFLSGYIDRAMLEREARAAMVLDDEQVYWLIGIESDLWYRFDSAQGQWVPDTPRALLQPATAGALPAPPAGGPPPAYTGGEIPLPIGEAENELFRQARVQQQRRVIRRIFVILAAAAGLLALIIVIGLIGLALYYNSLISPYRDAIAALANYQPQFQTARILAADGSLIAELTSREGGARTRVSLAEMSPEIVHAVLSAEDPTFYDDAGGDTVRIGRAMLQQITTGMVESGASSITQQIARNLVLQDSADFTQRRLLETVIADEIARTYDQNFILELYLNEVYFGNQNYGVEAASQFYFQHPASELNLPEAALLAGLIQAPARFDPAINREAAFTRMNAVLFRQAAVGCLQLRHAPYDSTPFCVTAAQVGTPAGNGMDASPIIILQRAGVESTAYQPRDIQVAYPHFVNYIQQQIEASYGSNDLFRRGMIIRTTLRPRLQDAAQAALAERIAAESATGVNTGSVMVTEPTSGAIMALVGSPDFANSSIDGQLNNAFTWQQPGGAILPVLYAAAFEGGIMDGRDMYLTPASILWDVPTVYNNPDFTPVNLDRQFRGPVSARAALANGYLVPAVSVLSQIGLDKFREMAELMGVRFLSDAAFGLSSAQGVNEVRLVDLMKAYGMLANDGVSAPLYSIETITASDGEPIALPSREPSFQAVEPSIAFLLQSILSDDTPTNQMIDATSPLVIDGFAGRRIAAMTGLSDGGRDLWTIGFSSDIAVGVWVGRHDNEPTLASVIDTAAPVWNAVMTTAMRGTDPEAFAPPSGVVLQQVCVETGTLYDINTVTPGCRSVRNEYFASSAPPAPASAGFFQQMIIDTWSGWRANQFCPNFTTVGTFSTLSNAATAWLNSPAGQAYAVSIGLETPISSAPATACDQNTQNPVVRFTNISDSQVLTGITEVEAIVIGPNFQSFRLELAPSSAPNNWEVIAGPFNTQQPGGVIANWDTTTPPNGAYRLRLYAESSNGGYAAVIINVSLNAPPPATPEADFTGEPTPIPTLIFATATPTPEGIPLTPITTAVLAQTYLPSGGFGVYRTQTAVAQITATPTAGPPALGKRQDVILRQQLDPLWQTATALYARQMGLTIPPPQEQIEPIWQTATAIYVDMMGPALEVQQPIDPILLTATQLVAGATRTAAAPLTLTAGALLGEVTPTRAMPTIAPSSTAAINPFIVQPGANPGFVPLGGGEIWRLIVSETGLYTIAAEAEDAANDRSEKSVVLYNLLDTVLTIRASDGTIIAQNDDQRVGAESDSRIVGLRLTPGAYFIEVRSYRDLSGGFYTLTFTQ